MLELGIYHDLEILRNTSVGLYLGEEGSEVLLPNKYVPENYNIGDVLRVFVYLDSHERIVATNIDPLISLHKFAFLKVTQISEFGAFLDCGLEKDLFVPFQEQAERMEIHKYYVVYCYLDSFTNRLLGSSKTNRFLSNQNLSVKRGDEVDLLVSHQSELGYNVIVNDLHKGLIYMDEIYRPLNIGDRIKGTIKLIRPDNKLDISPTALAYKIIEPNAAIILEKLKEKDGKLDVHDGSPPEKIYTLLGMSKKNFKKALGNLYKQKLIVLKEDGIELISMPIDNEQNK
ncbi:MAG: S1-like domain-containing RNA-binding protein [Saprospiraceae bacterium]